MLKKTKINVLEYSVYNLLSHKLKRTNTTHREYVAMDVYNV